MSKLKRLSAVIAAASVVIMVSASPAWAPRNLFNTGVLGECRDDGATTALAGGFEVESFDTGRDGLVAVGDLTVSCLLPGSTRTLSIDIKDAALPISITRATCQELYFDVDPFEYEGVEVDITSEIQFFVYDPLIDARKVEARLCTVERNHERWSPEQLARVLNAILFEEV